MKHILHFALALFVCLSFNSLSAQDLSVDPDTGEKGSLFPVTITGDGTDWQMAPYSYFYVNISGLGMTLDDSVIDPDGTIRSTANIMNDASAGPRDIEVAYYNGYEWSQASRLEAFQVLESSIASVMPDQWARGTVTTIEITGQNTNWTDEDAFIDTYCTDETNIIFNNIVVVDDNTITADVSVDSQTDLGPQDLSVYYLLNGISGGGRIDALPLGVEIIQGVAVEELRESNLNISISPNPFVKQLDIRYHLQEGAKVSIELFDFAGKQIATILEADQAPGPHATQFVADSQDFESGMYILKVTVDGDTFARSVINLK